MTLMATAAWAQAAYQAQIRGEVTDQSGAVVVNAAITITNDATNIAQVTHSDDHGQYFLVGLRPAVYTIKAESKGFRATVKKNIVLQVDQQTTVDFVLHPLGISETMEVTDTAPLLDTESPTLGTEITNEYVKEIPLINRNFFGLAFLSGGVTEVAGSGTQDNYPSGTNFVSNGQRNATAEVRIDGALISAPEQGEGATSNVYYEPSVEIVQEFKVQNNSFSAEFGNNGGTVVNMVLKSGSNAFHGSGWYFLQRAGTDARDFFNPEPNPKPAHKRDQGGFSLGGPIKKNKTFFFVDFEKVRDDEAINFLASVPTLAQRTGNFAPTATDPNPNVIFDPTTCGNPCVSRNQVQYNGQANVIPPTEIDPIGQAILNLYPKPNVNGAGEFNNFLLDTLSNAPDYQFDIKLDHQLNDRHRLSGRYSRSHSDFHTPIVLGDSEFGPSGDGIATGPTTVQNVSLEYSWTLNPRIVWTNRFAVDRVKEVQTTNIPSISSLNASLPAGVPGLPTVLEANGVDRLPTFQMSGNLPWNSLYDQCCVGTTFAHTLYSYSSQLVISKGRHLMKLGGEQRLFYNNFWQPPNPTGIFNFTDYVTSQFPNSNTDLSGNPTGNPFASLLFGYADNINGSSVINIYPSVANKSKETGFYFQDDWKVNAKLTLNLGLRYEWSTPYAERYNRVQFSNFTGDSGINLDLTSAQSALQGLGVNFPSSKELLGTTLFASSSMRSVPVDRNNFGPRLGFAYQLTANTVVRGGAGVYYGMSVATNFQYPGTAFRKTATMFFTNNDFGTQSATLENPFPNGLTPPQGKQYGPLAEWGYINQNDLGTTAARNADLYQWNLGIQHLFPSQLVIGVDYSANRSTHLPWGGYSSTRNRNYIPSALLAQVAAGAHAQDPACDTDSCVSNFLANTVNNPFFPLFSGPNAIFNEPDSRYGDPSGQIPLGNLLRPFPQFDANFEGLPLLEASSWYNSMQMRFQKRTTHHLSFEGSYTVSKLTDDSSVGANAFVGTLNNGNPQQLDNLKAEHGIGANDTPQRLAAAVVVELPIGRKKWIGGDMNRVLDAVVGGWSVSTLVTEQSGQPLAIPMASSRLMDGNQRPNVVCPNLKTGVSMHSVALDWQNVGVVEQPLSYININCFADPGDQIPGNAPRYFPGVRTDGIHNFDVNIYKEFVPKEGTRLEVRGEIFNFANHPRFGSPNTAYTPFVPGGSPQVFGTISGSAPGATPRRFQFGVRFEF